MYENFRILANSGKTRRITVNKIRLSAPITKSISRGLLSNFGKEEAKPGEEDPGRRIGRSMVNTVFAFRSTLSPLTLRIEQGEFSFSRARNVLLQKVS